MERVDNGDRHQGHVKKTSNKEIRQGFVKANGKDKPLDVSGSTIELDTTDTKSIVYNRIYEALYRVFNLN